jgi:hypothetical protein
MESRDTYHHMIFFHLFIRYILLCTLFVLFYCKIKWYEKLNSPEVIALDVRSWKLSNVRHMMMIRMLKKYKLI